jgi:ABC-type multidrug transport system ATPase subunit
MNAIEVIDLVKRYGDRTAVDGVSFTVEEGEIFAILGPNGAGKTTTVESISLGPGGRLRASRRSCSFVSPGSG